MIWNIFFAEWVHRLLSFFLFFLKCPKGRGDNTAGEERIINSGIIDGREKWVCTGNVKGLVLIKRQNSLHFTDLKCGNDELKPNFLLLLLLLPTLFLILLCAFSFICTSADLLTLWGNGCFLKRETGLSSVYLPKSVCLFNQSLVRRQYIIFFSIC